MIDEQSQRDAIYCRITYFMTNPNLFHGRSPLFEINTDLILAHPMPPGAVHTNKRTLTDTAPGTDHAMLSVGRSFNGVVQPAMLT